MKILKPVIAFLLCAAVLFGLNAVTAPVIANNEQGAALAAYNAVLPGAGGFEALDLENLPETVKGVYKESNGLGYAMDLSTTAGYTGSPLEFTLGVDAEGKITGLEVSSYPDTKDVGAEFLASFTGADSALAGVELVSGATYSSSAIKNAVSDGLNLLVENGLMAAGVKGDDQILKELLPGVHSGLASPTGILQLSEDSTDELMTAMNGSGFAGILAGGDATYLAVSNACGDVKIFDVEGNDVTASAPVSFEAPAAADTSEADAKKLTALAPEGATLEPIALNGVFNCVTNAFEITAGGETYYGFSAKPYGYANEVMSVYYILDANGAIYAMTSPEFILHAEYFSSYTLDNASYKAGFAGLTADSYSDDAALISGATLSSQAVSSAAKAVFEAFEIIAGGNAE